MRAPWADWVKRMNRTKMTQVRAIIESRMRCLACVGVEVGLVPSLPLRTEPLLVEGSTLVDLDSSPDEGLA